MSGSLQHSDNQLVRGRYRQTQSLNTTELTVLPAHRTNYQLSTITTSKQSTITGLEKHEIPVLQKNAVSVQQL